jgi:hypothetical protein
MPDEQGQDITPEEETPDTSLHAYSEGEEDQIEGDLNEEGDADADQVENTGGATSGGPGGDAKGEDDPSDV